MPPRRRRHATWTTLHTSRGRRARGVCRAGLIFLRARSTIRPTRPGPRKSARPGDFAVPGRATNQMTHSFTRIFFAQPQVGYELSAPPLRRRPKLEREFGKLRAERDGNYSSWQTGPIDWSGIAQPFDREPSTDRVYKMSREGLQARARERIRQIEAQLAAPRSMNPPRNAAPRRTGPRNRARHTHTATRSVARSADDPPGPPTPSEVSARISEARLRWADAALRSPLTLRATIRRMRAETRAKIAAARARGWL